MVSTTAYDQVKIIEKIIHEKSLFPRRNFKSFITPAEKDIFLGNFQPGKSYFNPKIIKNVESCSKYSFKFLAESSKE